MRRTGKLRIFLEIITIFSYIVIGITILTFLNYKDTDVIDVNKSYIGSIILAISVTEIVEFLSLKDIVKIKNIPNIIAAVLGIALSIVIFNLKKDITVVCIVWGICSIVLQIIKIANAGINLLRQPFLNGFLIVLRIIEIIYSAFLIAKTIDSLNWHLMYLGVALLVQAFLLIVEFMIHRYQK